MPSAVIIFIAHLLQNHDDRMKLALGVSAIIFLAYFFSYFYRAENLFSTRSMHFLSSRNQCPYVTLPEENADSFAFIFCFAFASRNATCNFTPITI